jgi:hypothetical protein
VKQFQEGEIFDTTNPDTLERYPNRIRCFNDPPRVAMAPLAYDVKPFEGTATPINPPTPNDLRGLFAIRVRPMDRISVWCIGLTNVQKQAAAAFPATPYRMELQLRVGFDCVSYAPPPRIIQPPGFQAPDQTSALLFQFTGLTATQFELWGCTISGGPAGFPGSQYVTFAVLISDTMGACCDPPGGDFWPGDWDITP